MARRERALREALKRQKRTIKGMEKAVAGNRATVKTLKADLKTIAGRRKAAQKGR